MRCILLWVEICELPWLKMRERTGQEGQESVMKLCYDFLNCVTKINLFSFFLYNRKSSFQFVGICELSFLTMVMGIYSLGKLVLFFLQTIASIP